MAALHDRDEWSRLGVSAFDGKPAKFTSDPMLTDPLLATIAAHPDPLSGSAKPDVAQPEPSCAALAAFADHVELQQQADDDTGHGDG